MFDYANKEKKPSGSLADSLQVGVRGEGRFAGLNRFRDEMQNEYDAEQKERSRLKDEMKDYREAYKEGSKVDDHYMECFPTYAEDDYQFSVKDNLSKRPPGGSRPGRPPLKRK